MVWGSDLSSPAVESTGSPPVHTGTAGRKQGGLERREENGKKIRVSIKITRFI